MNELVERITKKILDEIPDIALLAIVGSLRRHVDEILKKFSSGDVDILLILSKDDEDENKSFNKLRKLLLLLEQISKDNNVLIAQYNMIKNISIEIYKEHYNEYIVPIHLLLYPTPSAFISWENPWVVKRICEDALKNIIHGDKSILLDIISKNDVRLDPKKFYNFIFQRFINSIIYTPKEIKILSNFENKMMIYLLKKLYNLAVKNEQKNLAKQIMEVLQILNYKKSRKDIRERVLQIINESYKIIREFNFEY